MADPSRGGYPPPPQEYGNAGYPPHHSPAHQKPRDDSRSSYPPPPDHNGQGQYPPPPDASRQGQYPAPPPPQSYPPPHQWAGQPQGQPPYGHHHPPPPHHYDPAHAQYHYPPPAHPGQGPPPHDQYRPSLPPMQPYPYHYAPYQAPQTPAPRQRTAIACKYCRKRKIRCSGYDSSPDGRCQNCVRFNQQCLFHPVSSQAAFVPASALYGPHARGPMAGNEQQGQGNQQPMLYGAHGQPLGPAGPGGHPPYGYPPPSNGQPPPQHQGYPPNQYAGYPPPNYSQPPGSAPAPAPSSAVPAPITVPGSQLPYDQQAPPPTASSDQSDRMSLKRGPPDDDPYNENNGATHSPHPNAKARTDYHGRPSGSFEYQNPTSPATSTMSYQSYPPHTYTNGVQPPNVNGNNSPPGLTPNSVHSVHSPHSGNQDNRTPPPAQSGSASSSQNGRSGMRVHEMLGKPSHSQFSNEQRGRSGNDSDMLSKLNGRK